MSIKLRPEFDHTWFVTIGNKLIEAPSLRQLKKLVGSNYRFVGYHPNGYAAPLRLPYEKPKSVPHRVVIAKQPDSYLRDKKYDHEAILNMWAAGFTGPAIATKLNIPNWMRVGEIVCQHRKRGDPRAVPRVKVR